MTFLLVIVGVMVAVGVLLRRKSSRATTAAGQSSPGHFDSARGVSELRRHSSRGGL
ncbi:MAG: hypothetical protein WCI74_06230 [Actinomycetes bacterium]